MNNVTRLLAQAMTDSRVAACEDCIARKELTEIRPGLFTLEIKHDPTCPFFRALENN